MFDSFKINSFFKKCSKNPNDVEKLFEGLDEKIKNKVIHDSRFLSIVAKVFLGETESGPDYFSDIILRNGEYLRDFDEEELIKILPIIYSTGYRINKFDNQEVVLNILKEKYLTGSFEVKTQITKFFSSVMGDVSYFKFLETFSNQEFIQNVGTILRLLDKDKMYIETSFIRDSMSLEDVFAFIKESVIVLNENGRIFNFSDFASCLGKALNTREHSNEDLFNYLMQNELIELANHEPKYTRWVIDEIMKLFSFIDDEKMCSELIHTYLKNCDPHEIVNSLSGLVYYNGALPSTHALFNFVRDEYPSLLNSNIVTSYMHRQGVLDDNLLNSFYGDPFLRNLISCFNVDDSIRRYNGELTQEKKNSYRRVLEIPGLENILRILTPFRDVLSSDEEKISFFFDENGLKPLAAKHLISLKKFDAMVLLHENNMLSYDYLSLNEQLFIEFYGELEETEREALYSYLQYGGELDLNQYSISELKDLLGSILLNAGCYSYIASTINDTNYYTISRPCHILIDIYNTIVSQEEQMSFRYGVGAVLSTVSSKLSDSSDEEIRIAFGNILFEKEYWEDIPNLVEKGIIKTTRSRLEIIKLYNMIEILSDKNSFKSYLGIFNDTFLNVSDSELDTEEKVNAFYRDILFKCGAWSTILEFNKKGMKFLDEKFLVIMEMYDQIDNANERVNFQSYIVTNLDGFIEEHDSLEDIRKKCAEVQFDLGIWTTIDKLANNGYNLLDKNKLMLCKIAGKIGEFRRSIFIQHLLENGDLLSNISTYDISEVKRISARVLFDVGSWGDLVYLNRDGILSLEVFNDVEREIISVYCGMENYSMKSTFVNGILALINENENFLSTITPDKVKVLKELLFKIEYSNSSEMEYIAPILVTELLSTDNPLFYFDLLENIFLRNNIPYTGKLFKVFDILYPSEKIKPVIENNKAVSPMLKRRIAGERYRQVIFFDLIKANLLSNSRVLREYFDKLESGYNLYMSIKNGTISIDHLNPSERMLLESFRDCLETMYSNTQESSNIPFIMTDDLMADIRFVEEHFNGDKSKSLLDQLIRYFALISDFETAKQMMSGARDKADARNRETSKEPLRVHNGDFIRGIGGLSVVESILQNGNVAKEFLGKGASSDLTPLDTDFTMIMDSTYGKTVDTLMFSEILEKSVSKDWGPVFILLRGDDKKPEEEKRFTITRRGPKEEEFHGAVPDRRTLNRYEMFYSGVLTNAYGLRTGFPSTEIDCFIVDPSVVSIGKLGLEIAISGFYIPIYDSKSNNLLFSQAQYDELRSKMTGLPYVQGGDYVFADEEKLCCGGEVESIVSHMAESDHNVNTKRRAILESIRNALSNKEKGLNLKVKNSIDGDLSSGSVELIDTGSTGRGTNDLDVEIDGKRSRVDFDFIMRLDKQDYASPERTTAIIQSITENFESIEEPTIFGSNIRYKGVKIKGLPELVDIDITFIQKNDRLDYSTDMCLAERLQTISMQDAQKAREVKANIIIAKRILKEAGCYKPSKSNPPQGGLGGVGIENWILQNGGSFVAAIEDFLKVAEGKTFQEFVKVYNVWDFGKNHTTMAGKFPHDNFVSNMSQSGYEKMVAVLSGYLKKVKEQGQTKVSEEEIGDATSIDSSGRTI